MVHSLLKESLVEIGAKSATWVAEFFSSDFLTELAVVTGEVAFACLSNMRCEKLTLKQKAKYMYMNDIQKKWTSLELAEQLSTYLYIREKIDTSRPVSVEVERGLELDITRAKIYLRDVRQWESLDLEAQVYVYQSLSGFNEDMTRLGGFGIPASALNEMAEMISSSILKGFMKQRSLNASDSQSIQNVINDMKEILDIRIQHALYLHLFHTKFLEEMQNNPEQVVVGGDVPLYYSDATENMREIVLPQEEDWGEEIISLLPTPSLHVERFIDKLKISPLLDHAYSLDAGVGEGFTIEEHTKLVLESAQRHKAILKPKVVPLVPWNEFMLFLALHDIGKGIALEKEDMVFKSKISFKESELRETRAILELVMEHMKLPSKHIQIFSRLLDEDVLGLYFKDEISEEDAYDQIVAASYLTGVESHLFLNLFDAFHFADAFSYPALANSIFLDSGRDMERIVAHQKKFDSLLDRIKLANEGKVVMEELYDIKRDEAISQEFFQYFSGKIPAILVYVNSVRKQMFVSNPEEGPKQAFVTLKNSISHLSYLLATYYHNQSKGKKNIYENYKKFLNEDSMGRQVIHKTICVSAVLGFIDNCSSVQQLFEAMIQFNKDSVR